MKPKKRAVQYLLGCLRIGDEPLRLSLYRAEYQSWHGSMVCAIEELDPRTARKLREGKPIRRLPNGDLVV